MLSIKEFPCLGFSVFARKGLVSSVRQCAECSHRSPQPKEIRDGHSALDVDCMACIFGRRSPGNGGFAFVDPMDVHWMGSPLEWSRSAVYTAAFFAFWLVMLLCSLMTRSLARSAQDLNNGIVSEPLAD